MDKQLTALIVHDLKNALGVLEGDLALLKDAPDRTRATHAHAQCVALRERLIGFLTLYKAEEQGLLARIDAVCPEDFLQSLLAEHVSQRPELHITLTDNAMQPVAFFDEYLVELALEAALQNADRFAHSTIVVSCIREDGDLLFSITDDGPGLSATEDKPSTGLGMTLCKAIAEAHRNGDRRGSVQLENAADGGACFTLRLP
ncbi:ATP-binding protein [uncultured Oxalicibacterium sp.]|uniref:sensor histidine kinase n=1 Tax=uncultured Oxalicibacterium sp. TaxID=1168540 RepID=UPI0025D31347|nr:ATP-binding protein [uncultured Oxalicibacterium sp.]